MTHTCNSWVTTIDMNWLDVIRSIKLPADQTFHDAIKTISRRIGDDDLGTSEQIEETLQLIATSLIWAIPCHSIEEKDKEW